MAAATIDIPFPSMDLSPKQAARASQHQAVVVTAGDYELAAGLASAFAASLGAHCLPYSPPYKRRPGLQPAYSAP